MTLERWLFLEQNVKEKLTQQEIAEGWHFCRDWDGMLVGPGMPEKESCLCSL